MVEANENRMRCPRTSKANPRTLEEFYQIIYRCYSHVGTLVEKEAVGKKLVAAGAKKF